jgi:hypothetical protein
MTTTLFERPHASKTLESSGVKVKCQHRWPVGTSASSWSESAENTCSLRASAAETKIRLPALTAPSPGWVCHLALSQGARKGG